MTTRIDRERAFLEYQLKCRGGQGKLLDEAMVALDAIDAKTASLLQFNSMYLAGAIVLFGIIINLNNVGVLARAITLLTLVTIVICILIATVLCLSCISIVGPHTGVTRLTVQEYETKILQITTDRRTRYRIALTMSFLSSILGVLVTALLIRIGVQNKALLPMGVKLSMEGFPIQAVMALAVIASSSIAGFLIYRRLSAGRTQNPAEDKLVAAPVVTSTADTTSPPLGTVLGGFVTAIGASLFWGVGNVVTRYAAEGAYTKGRSGAVVDIALANYLSGCVTIFVLGYVLHLSFRRREAFAGTSIFAKPGHLLLAALSKGINTYVFVASVALVSAGVAATLENFHIVWTAIFASLLFKTKLPRAWIVSIAVILGGTALILQIWRHEAGARLGVVGVALAVVAGIAFALFVIIWSGAGDRANYLPRRAFDTAVFLGISGMVVAVLHLTFGRLLFGPANAGLFATLTGGQLALQLANGVFNVGGTYFLINEALKRMEKLGSAAGFLVCLGISYAVLFTLLAEAALFGTAVSVSQWVGVLLFSFGFATIRVGISRVTDETSPAATAATPRAQPAAAGRFETRLAGMLPRFALRRFLTPMGCAKRLSIEAAEGKVILKRGAVSVVELSLSLVNDSPIPALLRVESLEIAGVPILAVATCEVPPASRTTKAVQIQVRTAFGDATAGDLARCAAAAVAGTVLMESLVLPLRVLADAEFKCGRTGVDLPCDHARLRVTGYDLYATAQVFDIATSQASPLVPPRAPQV
jgi:drug/metabolite transporter (DMT)-like permease